MSYNISITCASSFRNSTKYINRSNCNEYLKKNNNYLAKFLLKIPLKCKVNAEFSQ